MQKTSSAYKSTEEGKGKRQMTAELPFNRPSRQPGRSAAFEYLYRGGSRERVQGVRWDVMYGDIYCTGIYIS